MKLTLNLALPDGEVYDIACNGEKRQINLPEKQAAFELDSEGEYTVCIEQQATDFLLKPFASWLVFVLTAAPKSFAAPLTRSWSICSEIIDK